MVIPTVNQEQETFWSSQEIDTFESKKIGGERVKKIVNKAERVETSPPRISKSGGEQQKRFQEKDQGRRDNLRLDNTIN